LVKVLWIGDAGSPTGFGRVTHEVAGGLARRGHDISVLGLGYAGDYDPYTDGLKVYRADRHQPGKDIFGARRVAELVDKVDADVHVIVHDPAAVWQYLFENPFDQSQSLLSRPVLAYCPVDGYDYPPDWTDILPQVTNFVAMSKFGQATFKPSGLVYHGVDHDDFWPVSERSIELDGQELMNKAECKEALGFDPDAFLVLRVDTNTGRKDYAATIKAVGPLLEAHRDMAMHLHASTNPEMPGIHIAKMLNRYDLARGQVTSSELRPGEGWDQRRLLTLYNAADLFVSTSRGEGFGLTIAEALACGVPVVAQNVSAIPEVVGPGGVLIDPERAITTPAGQDNRLADIDAFTETIERLYQNVAWRTELGLAGRKHVAESFKWTDAVDSFHDFIERAAARWRASQEAGDAIQQHERTA
jgi:glycosyltransferase involved in cell wall biosynthesis